MTNVVAPAPLSNGTEVLPTLLASRWSQVVESKDEYLAVLVFMTNSGLDNLCGDSVNNHHERKTGYHCALPCS